MTVTVMAMVTATVTAMVMVMVTAARPELEGLDEDEGQHLRLAWGALAWMCRSFGPEVRAAVARVFAQAEDHVGFGATTTLRGDVASMRAHGYLTIAERRAVAVTALAELVWPAAQALGEAAGSHP